jgi:hypothetical protein
MGFDRLLAFSIFLLLQASARQPSELTHNVNIEPLNKYAPVKVSSLEDLGTVYQNPLGPHQIIKVKDDTDLWINNLSLHILNQSEKPIVAIEFEVEVPEWRTSSAGPRHFIFFHVGHFPTAALLDAQGNPTHDDSNESLRIDGSATGLVTLNQAFEKLQAYPLRTTEVSEISSIWIRIRRVFFSDGTMWVTNQYHKPSPSTAGLYIPITSSEFHQYR